MHRPIRLPAAPAAALAVLLALALGPAAPRPSTPPDLDLTANTNAACNTPQPEGFARCFAVVRTPADHQVTPDAAAPPPTALGPAEIRDAYRLPDAGTGQTVAIVDALGDSHAEDDLGIFRSYYGLPPCTSANGCFRKVDQAGGTNYPPDDTGWAVETSLDLDAVSAACPSCDILLVEARTNTTQDLGGAVNMAVSLGAKFVSNSYGTTSEVTLLDRYYRHAGVAVVASSGDDGGVVQWPASSPDVVSVGGTRLTRDGSTARGWSESVWGSSAGGEGGGSGCSAAEPQPSYQLGIATECARRATADIAADADPDSGLATYDSLGQGGWLQLGGTSLAAPLVTAAYALAGAPVPDTFPVNYPYHDPTRQADLFDVTDGANAGCGTVLCQAGPGWDGPTGLGTPDGVGALIGKPQGSIAGVVADQTSGTPVAGATVVANPGGYVARTDANGQYRLDVAAGDYELTAQAFGYQSVTQSGVQAAEGQTTTANLTLAPAPTVTLSGKVTDGSGHGWPLYAEISVPDTPIAPVFTNPYTGEYSIQLPADTNYTVRATASYPGYQPLATAVTVGSTGTTDDIALPVDPGSCTAPGYAFRNGIAEDFTAWPATTATDGWSVSGSKAGWRFDNPGDRPPPGDGEITDLTASDDDFAIVDSDHQGNASRQDSELISPVVDLSNQQNPHLTFDTGFYPDKGRAAQNATVDLSTDGGRSWRTVWRASTSVVIGPVDVPIPTAAGAAQARVRFHYVGQHSWWWAVDDVHIGQQSCEPTAGGLLAGVVTDAGTGKPVNGATITSGDQPAEHGTSAATGDPGMPGGFYWLFSSLLGSHPFTAAADGYDPATTNVSIVEEQVAHQDWALTAAGGGQ